jgi:hypothetical protein
MPGIGKPSFQLQGVYLGKTLRRSGTVGDLRDSETCATRLKLVFECTVPNLFVAEGHYGIQAGGFIGRPDPEEEPDGDGHHHAQHGGP